MFKQTCLGIDKTTVKSNTYSFDREWVGLFLGTLWQCNTEVTKATDL